MMGLAALVLYQPSRALHIVARDILACFLSGGVTSLTADRTTYLKV